MAEGIGAGEIKDVVEVAGKAGEAISHAVHGEWDKAADSALSMTESAVSSLTGGVSKAVEEAYDGIAKDNGLPSAHDAINLGAHAVGDALGDGLSALVGTDQSVQSLHSFDEGDILGGIGHMAEGAADTIGGAVSQGLSDAGSALGDLLGGSDSGGAAQGGSDGAAQGGSDGSQAAIDSMSDPSGGQASADGGAGLQISADGG
jgi:hypothetical protein